MKIAHISDIHIRNLRYHDEYKTVFENLYKKLKELDVDLIVNTGDTAHTKVQISPEFVQMASEFFTRLGEITTTFVILGNHDLNLNNSNRLDAISPIVKNIDNVFLLTSDGQHVNKDGLILPWAGRKSNLFQFWLYDITCDENKHPKKERILEVSQKLAAAGRSSDSSLSNVVNIGLFHGSVFGAVIDSGFELVHYEADMKRFDGMDFVMLGDIHKRQSFMNGRAWYPGSLIQQNFGEDPGKGFLVWDIKTKDDFDVSFHELKGSRGFYTVKINSDLVIPDLNIPQDARIRAVVDSEMTLSQQKDLEKELKLKFLPKDIVSIVSSEKKSTDAKIEKAFDPNESYKNKLFDYARSRGADDLLVSLIDLYDDECVRETSEEDVRQNAFWKINSIGWSNLFNYGESNIIDFSKTEGLSGIFAPNGSGKSSLFDIILLSLFDKITKDVPKNIDLINDNRDLATIVVDLSIGDENYIIERQIERIKYGQRKFSEAKEWGKTTLSFYKSTEDGKVELSENGISRSETEKQVRRLIGTFDEFVMTSMVSQSTISGIPGGADIINCKESDRKKILFKFLGLDQFETRAEIAKEKLKKLSSEMKIIENESSNENLIDSQKKLEEFKIIIEALNDQLRTERTLENHIAQELQTAKSAIFPVVPEDPEIIKKKIATAESALQVVSDRGVLDSRTILEIEGKLKKLKKEEPPGSEVLLSEIVKQKNEISKKKNSLTSEVEKKLVVINNAKKASATISQVPCEGKFPTCQFLTDAFSAQDSLEEMINSYNSILMKKQDNENEFTKITDLEIISKKYAEWKTEVNTKESEITLLEQRITLNDEVLRSKQDDLRHLEKDLKTSILAEEEREKVKSLKFGIENLEKKLKVQQKESSATESSVLQMQRKYGSIESQIEKIKQSSLRLEEIRKQVSAYEIYTEAMGKHGIPYTILTGMLPFINEEINRILSQVVGFKVFLEHDQSEQTIRIYIQYNDFKSRSLSLAGGAEKFIASLAIRVALISVSRLPKTNLLIVDEGFGKLDSEMMDSVQKMFEHLKTIFGNVFVVSHVEAMKDMVDTIIEISTDDSGYAHVEVV